MEVSFSEKIRAGLSILFRTASLWITALCRLVDWGGVPCCIVIQPVHCRSKKSLLLYGKGIYTFDTVTFVMYLFWSDPFGILN